MIIKISRTVAGIEAPAGSNICAYQGTDLSCPEDKIVLFPQTASPVSCEYPQELTLQLQYVNRAKAKPFQEEAGHLGVATAGLEISVLRDAFEEATERGEISNLLDSGLEEISSEFFPEAA